MADFDLADFIGDLSYWFLEVRAAAVLARADFYGEWNRGVYAAPDGLRELDLVGTTSNLAVDLEDVILLCCGVMARALSGDVFLAFFPFLAFFAVLGCDAKSDP